MVRPITAESRALVISDSPIKPGTDKSSRLYQISLVAGIIILSVGAILSNLLILPVLALGALVIGSGLIIVSVDKLQKQKIHRVMNDYSMLDGLADGRDPLKFNDALKMLGIPEDEKENLGFITERYQFIFKHLQKGINKDKASPFVVASLENLMADTKTAYLTLTKNIKRHFFDSKVVSV